MTIDPEAIGRAFEAFHARYVAKPKREWNLDHHKELWEAAQGAVVNGDVERFAEVYSELRRHWQLTRGKGATLAKPEAVFELLCGLPTPLRQARLSAQTLATAPDLLQAVNAMSAVKRSKGGLSIMAISKILHFFNPRLFVIVDRGMMWNWSLNHLWLWRPIDDVRERLKTVIPKASEDSSNGGCDPLSYIAILVWAGKLLRDNPEVPLCFERYLRTECRGGSLPEDLETYEAVAVEWLLLGLVELPPPGVRFA